MRVWEWIYLYSKAKEELSKLEGILKKYKELKLQSAWFEAKDRISSWLAEHGIKADLPDECPYKLDEVLERNLEEEVRKYLWERRGGSP